MILSDVEAAEKVGQLSQNEKEEIERDKIRFGEYFISSHNNCFYRVNPCNVIYRNGIPELIENTSITLI